MYGDHDICVKIFPCNVGGQIVHNRAIHEVMAVVTHGREYARNRNGGAHSLRHWTATEYDRLKTIEISCYAPEWNRQLIEGNPLSVIRAELFSQKLIKPEIREYCIAKTNSILESESDRLRKIPSVLPAAISYIAIRSLQCEKFRKKALRRDLLQVFCRMTRSIQTPDQRSHAGAR